MRRLTNAMANVLNMTLKKGRSPEWKLSDSIRVERVGPSYHNHRMVRVRAGGYITNPKTGRLVNYAAVVEQKYPYMRPAWEVARQYLVS